MKLILLKLTLKIVLLYLFILSMICGLLSFPLAILMSTLANVPLKDVYIPRALKIAYFYTAFSQKCDSSHVSCYM